MKRLIICCDGTWHHAEQPRTSNVVDLGRAILPRSDIDAAEQVLFYQPGLGSEHGKGLAAGISGAGIDRDIQDAYRFLVHNYRDGDEIWCFGFSRGAYTVRSLVGLLRNAWLLDKREAARIPDAYHIYRTKWGPDADNATRFRDRWCRPVQVHFLGVWDTVGALGIPLELFSELNDRRYAFHDTRLSRIVRHAYHAVAIDERREPFRPTLWQTHAGRTHTEQCWFAGSHGDVGGTAQDPGLGAICLRWIADAASGCGLALDETFLRGLTEHAGAGHVYRSDRGLWRALGRAWRPIGRRNHDESVHVSAEQRFLRDPDYRPRNLREWFEVNDQLRLPLH